jgi:hypothetical protein
MLKVFLLLIGLLVTSNSYAGTIEVGHEETSNGISNNYASTLNIVDKIEDMAIKVSYEYGKTDDIIIKDSGNISLGYDPELNERWGLWLDETIGYNKIINIDYENMLGIGLRYYIMKNDYGKLSISGGILYHYISEQEEGRYSWMLKYGNDIYEVLYFYQPSFKDSNDYITKVDSSIKVAELNDFLTMKLYYKTEYRSIIEYDYEKIGVKFSIEY